MNSIKQYLRKRKRTIITIIIMSVVVFGAYQGTIARDKTIEQSGAEEKSIENEKTQNQRTDRSGKTIQTPKKETAKKLGKVGKNYLNGALFIGDSRTSTLYEYAGWKKTDFYVEYGMTIWTVMDSKIAIQKDTGKKITVKQALSETQYKKIYIMLGINELGRGTSTTFYKQYQSVVKQIRKLQPDAIIYIQSILHVTDEKDQENSYINNKEINRRNKKLMNLANGQDIFYLKLNMAFDKEKTGKLNSKYTTDGVHIKPKYIYIWKNYLLNHGIK